jgi:hypothetical protein
MHSTHVRFISFPACCFLSPLSHQISRLPRAPTPKCEDLYPFASAHKHTPSLKHHATCCPSKELKATTIGCKQAHRINRREKAAADWRHLKLWSVIKPNPGRSYTFNSDLFDFEAASPAQPSHPRRYA